MATYAIGDLHGCYDTLRALLARIEFSRRQDRLWLVGDLVNRGPRSLAVLRWAVEMGDALVAVLGNHDLYLLARAAGVVERRRRDTLDPVLEAADRDDLLGWLRTRPLLHREGDRLLVHAGLFPEWSADQAERLARAAEERLRGRAGERLLRSTASKRAAGWRHGLTPGARARTTLAAMARMRALDASGRMSLDFSGRLDELPKGYRAWFDAAGRRTADCQIVFGHWAAIGLHLAPGIAGIDTGCVWGQRLTALRLDDGALFHEPARES